MLHALQHPCIVSSSASASTRSASRWSLAPLGSLNTVLSENARGGALHLESSSGPTACRAQEPAGAGHSCLSLVGHAWWKQESFSTPKCWCRRGCSTRWRSLPFGAQTELCSESRFSAIIWEVASFTHPSKEAIGPP